MILRSIILTILFSFTAVLSFAQIKTAQDLISVFESSSSSLDQVLETFSLKYHTTTSNVKIYKGSYQDLYVTLNENQISEVLLRNHLGYKLKSVEKSLSGDCKLMNKDKKRRIYTNTKYQFAFVINDSKNEVALTLK